VILKHPAKPICEATVLCSVREETLFGIASDESFTQTARAFLSLLTICLPTWAGLPRSICKSFRIQGNFVVGLTITGIQTILEALRT